MVRATWGRLDDQTREAIDGTGDHEDISADLEYAVYGGTSRSDTIQAHSNFGFHTHAKRARTATSTMGSESVPIRRHPPIKTRHSSAGGPTLLRPGASRRHVRAVIGLIFAIELIVLAVWTSLAWALDVIGRRPHSRATYDAIIVPGCAVLSSGMPSRALARRTRLAVHLLHEELADTLVLTGGVGRFPPAESEAARDLAVQLGVEPDTIRIETRSTTTAENARFAADLFDAPETLHVLVVSDAYHGFRCRRLFAHATSARWRPPGRRRGRDSACAAPCAKSSVFSRWWPRDTNPTE